MHRKKDKIAKGLLYKAGNPISERSQSSNFQIVYETMKAFFLPKVIKKSPKLPKNAIDDFMVKIQ